jgi:membrane protease YdiL (CAAX protease family)
VVRKQKAPWEYAERTRHLPVNLLFLAPWLLVYLLCWWSAGDAVETAAAQSVRTALRLLGPRPLFYVTLATALALCGVVWMRLRRAREDADVFPFMILEGVVFGFALQVTAQAMAGAMPVGRWIGLSSGTSPSGLDLVRRLGIAVGAGIFEEAVFRGLVCYAVFRAFKDALGTDRYSAGAVAILVSSYLFAAYHHWGAGGEAWDAARFAFRFHAGAVLGIVFLTRGLGIAAFAHGFYDALVLLR